MIIGGVDPRGTKRLRRSARETMDISQPSCSQSTPMHGDETGDENETETGSDTEYSSEKSVISRGAPSQNHRQQGTCRMR